MTGHNTAKNVAPSNVLWTAQLAVKSVYGRLHGADNWAATGLSIDSRTVKDGDLFIALKGDHGDGHAYVRQALDKGAVAAIVSVLPEDALEGDNLILVEDTLKALEHLGHAARARTGAKVIAVTGSVGKTGTKEMLASAFKTLGQTHYSGKSFNNHWGVPFSLSAMHEGSDYGIFEVGMNHPGEITPLTKQIMPDIAIITTIKPVHIEHFPGGESEIAAAKAEIFNGVKKGGSVILNRDIEHFAALEKAAKTMGIEKIYSFGGHEEADCRMLDCLEAANGTRVRADVMGDIVDMTLQTLGRHLAENALSVLLAIKVSGGDVRTAAKALEQIEPLPGRGKREYIDMGVEQNPVTLIDESYNASPAAMRAAFKVLAMIDPGRGGRRIAILGDMYELGEDAAQQHKDLALPLKAANVDLVYTCGPLMKNLHDSLPPEQKGVHKEESTELAEIVPDVLVPGDVVMVKGSRGGGEKPRMQLVVEAMRALPETRRKQKEKRNAL